MNPVRESLGRLRRVAAITRRWPPWFRRKSTSIVVFGMHRSGTSFTTSLLSLAGANTGPNLLRPDQANPHGYFEDRTVVRINDEILAASGGSWSSPPRVLSTSLKQKLKICELLVNFGPEGVLLLKDPRLTLTYEAWRPYLGPVTMIVSFRNPQAVVHSLRARAGLPEGQALDLWKTYNRRLLNLSEEEEGRTFWFNFDIPMSNQEVLSQLCKETGLTWSPDILSSLYDPTSVHFEGDEAVDDADAQSIHGALLDRWSGLVHSLEHQRPD